MTFNSLKSPSFKVTAAFLVIASAYVWADLEGSYVLPLDHDAIQYATAPVDDAVSRLQKTIAAGNAKLEYHPDFGYLPAVLEHLNVPVSSQVLVFSKTSFQAPKISPRMPRAIYFNGEVAVGYVRGGDVLEITSVDPRQGVMFYTVDQEQAPLIKFSRKDQCLQCHASGSTLGVPGLVVRSVFPDRTGTPMFQMGSFVTDHRSPFAQRWGGWYVTGTHGLQQHLGNTVARDKDKPETFQTAQGNNVVDLAGRIDTGAYLSPHSDLIALMVLEHQTRMQNLITRVGFETRMALHDQQVMNKILGDPADHRSETTKRRIRNAVGELLRYLLFDDEAPLTHKIRGTSDFAREYSTSPLRELDLNTRLFKYRCSPLIESRAFDNLPDGAKQVLYPMLAQRLASDDRAALRQILLKTKPDLRAGN